MKNGGANSKGCTFVTFSNFLSAFRNPVMLSICAKLIEIHPFPYVEDHAHDSC
jgi:hypothetical protein